MINIFKTRAGMTIRKYAPEILTGLGIAGFVTSTIFACKATSKVEKVLDEHKKEMNNLNKTETRYDYPKNEIVKAKAEVLGKTSLELVKLYSPAVGFGIFGVTCVLGGHGIMRKRNAAIGAAYALVSSQFKEYRDRVKEQLGEGKDRQFLYGLKEETVTVEETDENGKTKKVKKTVEVVDPTAGISPYAKIFDDGNLKWQNDPFLNLAFLKDQQNWMNDKLRVNGVVFLNEVYDALGFPRTSEGQLVGWVLDGDNSDNYIDFGIYALENQANRDFINGYDTGIFLDFNVDGIVYDLI